MIIPTVKASIAVISRNCDFLLEIVLALSQCIDEENRLNVVKMLYKGLFVRIFMTKRYYPASK